MARTRVFQRLRGLAQSLRANTSLHPERAESCSRASLSCSRADPRASTSAISRRRFLRQSTGAVAALGLVRALPGCAEDKDNRLKTAGIIGAGLAGLHCAYRLRQAGFEVRVYEASERVGGRMFTAHDQFPEGQLGELGGELIDSNHIFMQALAGEFGLTLDDRLADAPEGYVFDTWFVAGQAVPEATIVAQFSAVAPALHAAMLEADCYDDRFEELDKTPLSAYLDQEVPSAVYPELHAILKSAYVGEFGLECEEQSALNLIYLIGSDDPDPFRIFGASDEKYHVHGGNDQITSALAKAIEPEPNPEDGADEKPPPIVETGMRLVAAEALTRRYRITLEDQEGTLHHRDFGHLVFALPFTMLRKVALSGLALSEQKDEIIRELGYGTNAKVMGAFAKPVWRDPHNASGSVTSDLPLQQTWDSSIGQEGETAVLTNFLGGNQGVASGEGTPEAWFTGILSDLDRIYPGAQDAYLSGTAVRMHWPSYPYTRGSYACYRPGQWSYWTLEGETEHGRLHFCGEHTSAEFQGWMEGAAESGGRVAKEILDTYEIPLPKALAALFPDSEDDESEPDGGVDECGDAAQESRFFPQRAKRLRTRLRKQARVG
jgi:monoamine oxidase